MSIEVGNVCRCRHNKFGVITKILPGLTIKVDNRTYFGIGFDGKNWQSKKPIKIAENIEEYLDQQEDEWYDAHIASQDASY